ncbi:gamma carbonic anhydrase family protein [Pacificispira sp.]|uniref:gamma carbonic anhydrase family protein n=1 Tax=Pacificispira sp. TaxID=2888761 RepID=UPI003BABD077
MSATPIIVPFQGKHPKIDPTAYVAPGVVLVGDVTIGAHASVWFGSVLRGDDQSITVGEGSNVQDGTVIHVTLDTGPTIIGRNVTIGHGVRLHGCTLEDRCLVGIGAIVLDGAVVKTGSFVAAGALVGPGKVIPTGELWGGNPARKLRDMRPDDESFLDFDAEHYRRRAREFLAGE